MPKGATVEDDQGKSFDGSRLAPIPPELARVISARSRVAGHLALVLGLILLAMGAFMPPRPRSGGYARGAGNMISVGGGVIVLLGAAACYAGLIPSARADRRVLLKRDQCPVCLEPLDKHGARGETITCACGATWERRFL